MHLPVALIMALFARAPTQAAGAAQDLTELDLEQLMEVEIDQVVSASLHAQSTFDAPASVTVISGDEIRAHGYRTLFEILRSVTGVYTTYDRAYGHIGVRGFFAPGDYNSRVLLLVDGHRVNDPIFSGFGLSFDAPVDPALVERVEIIRGPGSALYGSNALFGVVNVISRRGGDVAGFEGAVEIASDDTYLSRATFGGANDDGEQWLVSMRGYSSAGRDLFYDEFATTPSGGHTSGTDYERAWSIHTQFDWSDWSFNAAYAWREKGVPTGFYSTVFNDNENHALDATGLADLTWTPDLGADRSALLRTYYTDYRYGGWYVYDDTGAGGPPDLLFRDRAIGQALGLDAQLAFDETLGGLLTVGSNARWNFVQDQKGWDALYGTYYDEHSDSFEWGVFAQDEIALTQRTTLVAGGRFDRYESFGGRFTPRAALVFAADACTSLKLLYGEAFRAPNASELTYNVGLIASAPELEPELTTSVEAVAEHLFENGWRASCSLFHYEIDDLIVRVEDPVTFELLYRNADAFKADGLELELERRFAGARRLRLSAALQEVEDLGSGERAANSPREVLQLVGETPFFTPQLLAAVEAVYVGERRTLAGDSADAYVLTNLALRARELAPGVELALIARNVLDQAYSDPVGPELVQDTLQQDGFSLALSLSVRL